MLPLQISPQRRKERPGGPSRRTCACSPPQATEEKEAHVTVRGDVNEDKDNDGAEKQSNKRWRKGARALRTT